MREPCCRSVFLISEELADLVEHEVWWLDLQIKVRSSEYYRLHDFEYCVSEAKTTGKVMYEYQYLMNKI